MLHIADLALYRDLLAGSFLLWTRNRSIFKSRSRDMRLQELYQRYVAWCNDNRHLLQFSHVEVSCSGIPHGSRAKLELFSKEGLTKPNAYPSIGQKKLSGAAARLMLNFALLMAYEIQRDFPTDVHRSQG